MSVATIIIATIIRSQQPALDVNRTGAAHYAVLVLAKVDSHDSLLESSLLRTIRLPSPTACTVNRQ